MSLLVEGDLTLSWKLVKDCGGFYFSVNSASSVIVRDG